MDKISNRIIIFFLMNCGPLTTSDCDILKNWEITEPAVLTYPNMFVVVAIKQSKAQSVSGHMGITDSHTITETFTKLLYFMELLVNFLTGIYCSAVVEVLCLDRKQQIYNKHGEIISSFNYMLWQEYTKVLVEIMKICQVDKTWILKGKLS